MKRFIGIVIPLALVAAGVVLFLAGCGGSSSPPPAAPPPQPPSPSINIPPGAAWAITQGSAPRPLVNGVLDFPQCPSASACYVSYVEVPLQANISQAAAVTLTYTITGDNPVFVYDTPGNSGVSPSSYVHLLLHQAGDNLSCQGAYAYYRWFSIPQALEFGTHTLNISLHDLSLWTPCFPPGNAAAFSQAIAHIGMVGFAFGGGDFAGHGVAVASGSARFTIDSFSIR